MKIAGDTRAREIVSTIDIDSQNTAFSHPTQHRTTFEQGKKGDWRPWWVTMVN
jgi:hypothetical protein